MKRANKKIKLSKSPEVIYLNKEASIQFADALARAPKNLPRLRSAMRSLKGV